MLASLKRLLGECVMRARGRGDHHGVNRRIAECLLRIFRGLHIGKVSLHFVQSGGVAIDDPDDFTRLFVVEIANEVRSPLASPNHRHANHCYSGRRRLPLPRFSRCGITCLVVPTRPTFASRNPRKRAAAGLTTNWRSVSSWSGPPLWADKSLSPGLPRCDSQVGCCADTNTVPTHTVATTLVTDRAWGPKGWMSLPLESHSSIR